MIIIEVNQGIEKALRKYKAKHRKLKIKEELRDRQYFKKKSVKKRQEKIKAVYVQQLKDKDSE